MINHIENKDLLKDYEYIKSKFEDFFGFMEINDFRTFLLLTINYDEGDFMNKLMEGPNTNRTLCRNTITSTG